MCGDRFREIEDVLTKIQDGDTVILSAREPFGPVLGLAARKEELGSDYVLLPSHTSGAVTVGGGQFRADDRDPAEIARFRCWRRIRL